MKYLKYGARRNAYPYRRIHLICNVDKVILRVVSEKKQEKNSCVHVQHVENGNSTSQSTASISKNMLYNEKNERNLSKSLALGLVYDFVLAGMGLYGMI